MANKIPERAVDSNFSVQSLSPDDTGVFTIIEYKRKDNTLHARSTLQNRVDGKYQAMKWSFFDAAGTALLYETTWALSYDTIGNIVSKVVGS